MAKTKRRPAQTLRRAAQVNIESQQRKLVQETSAAEINQSVRSVPLPSRVETTTPGKQEPRVQRPETSRAAARAQVRATHQRYQQKQRNPWLLVGIVVAAVAIIVAIFMFLANQNSGSTSRKPTDPVVLKAINNVDPSILEAVNTGGIQDPLKKTQGSPPKLTGPTGKPEVFYDGAEFCPYCAGERWSVAVALSRFGKFTKLPETTSASDDIDPDTSTVSFYGSSYSSSYIDFVPVEEMTNQSDGNGSHVALQTPTVDETKIISTYNGPPYTTQPGIPFISIANQYLELGRAYDPTLLRTDPNNANSQPLSQQDIATQLSNSSSIIAKNVLGTANYLTASICTVTNNQPASVCQTGVIPSIEQSLPKTQGSTHIPGIPTSMATEPGALIGRRQD